MENDRLLIGNLIVITIIAILELVSRHSESQPVKSSTEWWAISSGMATCCCRFSKYGRRGTKIVDDGVIILRNQL